MITSSKIERDLRTGDVLEATLHLLNLENFEGVDFMIAERMKDGYAAMLPDTPVIITHSLPALFETIAATYRADFEQENTIGMRL